MKKFFKSNGIKRIEAWLLCIVMLFSTLGMAFLAEGETHTSVNKPTPVRTTKNGDMNMTTSPINRIACGSNHNIALKSDGTVFAWGDNQYGQSRIPAGLNDVIAIFAGSINSYALKSDGTAVAWGSNQYGQGAIPAGLNDIVAMSPGLRHNVAIKSDGTVVAWGYNDYGKCTVPAELNDVVAIAAGNNHSLALKNDGIVVGWGNNDDGKYTTPAGLDNVVAIAAGNNHSLALRFDGTVVAWGGNNSGQCTIPTGLDYVVAIAAGNNHSLALKGDGTIVGWGSNGSGQCPSDFGINDAIAIAAGNNHSLALKSDGTVVAWGGNNYGQCTIPAGLNDVVAISAGLNHSVALKSDGTIVGWGDNQNGQCTIPAESNDVVTISAGGNQTLALRSDGAFVMWGAQRLSCIEFTFLADLNLLGDFSLLNTEIANTSNVGIETNYTASSWNNYQLALINAQNIKNDTWALQKNIDSARINLNIAINNLLQRNTSQNETIYVGDAFEYNPSLLGGSWDFDSAYLEMTANGNKVTFKGLKSGATKATYTKDDYIHVINLIINDVTYALTVVSGTGSGLYAAGAKVTITADAAPDGEVFDKWTATGGGTFANASSASTTFTMPGNTATVTATYKADHTHTWGDNWKSDATGHWHECDCGEKNDTVAHTSGDWIIDVAATETTDGSKHKECTVCSYVIETEVIPSTGVHTWGTKWESDAGNHWHECDCGEKNDTATHTPSDWIIDVVATETTEGSKHKECTVCNYVTETEVIPATGSGHTHDFGSEWKKDATGHWNECDCGEKDSFAVHASSDWIVDLAATATTDGSKHKECTFCSYVIETEVIPATGSGHTHDFEIDWESDEENHWHECSCGEKNDKAPHTPGDWIVDVAATTTTVGSRYKECTVCDYVTVAENIPKTPMIPKKDQFTYSLDAKTYSGKAHGVSVTSKSGVGKVTAVYYNTSKTMPTNVGSYVITVDVAAGTQYGAVTGLSLGTFTINKGDLSKIQATIADTAWTGKQVKPIKFTYNGMSFSVSSNATVKSYGKNKDIGKGTITLVGKGNFTGTKTITFSITPNKNPVSKIIVGKNQMKVKWKKGSAAQKIKKYQVRYRVKGTSKWKTKAYNVSTSSAIIRNLKKHKQYEVQVRSYKTVSGVKYYGAWSKEKTSDKIK